MTKRYKVRRSFAQPDPDDPRRGPAGEIPSKWFTPQSKSADVEALPVAALKQLIASGALVEYDDAGMDEATQRAMEGSSAPVAEPGQAAAASAASAHAQTIVIPKKHAAPHSASRRGA